MSTSLLSGSSDLRLGSHRGLLTFGRGDSVKLFVVPRLKSRSLAFISRVSAPEATSTSKLPGYSKALLSTDPIANADFFFLFETGFLCTALAVLELTL